MSDDQTTQLKRALVALKDMRARLESVERARSEPIAIIGLGCRFPGGADSPEAFWRLLEGGVDAISEAPADRWDANALYDPDPEAPGRVTSRWGGFLSQIDQFDPLFFGISPREAEGMDPQQRLLLEVAWEALERAGQTRDRLAGSSTGVFVGVHSHSSDYYLLQATDPTNLDIYSGTGTAHNVLSGRLAYLWDLRGPNVAVDTACSSSLVATHLAVQSLRNGECAMAIVGGVNVMATPHFTVAASRMRMLAPDGRCKTFDARADGFVRGEGCGVVVLKRLSDALADGDPIQAVIRGSAINQDGHTNGLTAPSGLAQEAVLRQALANAQVDPAAITYVETHGTGTPLGDPIEIEALGKIIGKPRPDGMICSLGSVKTNIGHLEGAAGLAGLIKTVLALQHGRIPASLHFEQLNPHIQLDGTRLTVAAQAKPWPTGGATRVAGVSSFGWSGTNAHVVLEEAPAVPTPEPATERRVYALPISAHNPGALVAQAQAFSDFLSTSHDWSLADIAYTAGVRRTPEEHRLVVVGETHAALAERLAAHGRGEPTPGLAVGQALPNKPLVAFVFPGQGSQWLGMGRELLEREPVFRETIERCERALAAEVSWSLTDQLRAGPETSRFADIDVIQPVLFAMQMGLAALWQSWGITPDAVVGHSMGEIAAACVAGSLSLEDAVSIIARRSALLKRVSGQGAMAVIGVSRDEAVQALAGREDRLSVAVSNSPRSTVIAGQPEALEEVLALLRERNVFCRRVNVDVASHSPQMDPLRTDLLDALKHLKPRQGVVPMRSTVTGEWAGTSLLDASYWARNLRQPVLFTDAIAKLAADGYSMFVEISPHPVLLTAIDETLQHAGATGLALASLRRDEAEQESMLTSLGALHARGAEVKWERLLPAGARQVAPLPTYPWQRERYWVSADPSTGAGPSLTLAGEAHPLLGRSLDLAGRADHKIWLSELDRRHLPFAFDHALRGRAIAPASYFVALALAAAADVYGDSALEIRDLALERPLLLPDDRKPVSVQVTLERAPGGWAISLHSWGGNGWIRHAQGRLADATTDGAEVGAGASPAGDWEPAQLFYESLEAAGVQLRGQLRQLARVQHADGTVRAEITGTAEGGASTRIRPINPLLIDACFQLTAALLPPQPDAIYMPARIGRVTLAAREVAPSLYEARARLRAEESTADLWLVDGAGQRVLTLADVALASTARGAEGSGARLGLYRQVWKATPAARETTTPAAGGWLVVADDSALGLAVQAQLGSGGEVCLVATPGVTLKQLDERQYTADLSNPEQVRQLIEALTQSAKACRGVIVIRAARTTDETMTTDLERGLAGSLASLQSLVGSSRLGSGRLWIVTRGAQRVGGEPSEALLGGLAGSALWGLGRVLAEEQPDRWGGLIDLDPAASTEAAAQALAQELRQSGGAESFEVCYRGAERFVARLMADAGERPARPYAWRPDASYMLTGGFGGVGLEIARDMIAQGARRLVIVGRTAIPLRDAWAGVSTGRVAEIVAGIRDLEARGASVHYAAFDIADQAALKTFLDRFEAEAWPPIRGVVHAAAAFDNDLLTRLDAGRLHAAVSAKAEGAWALHQALGPLDFFVMFSSIAALLPLAGQGAYAAANAYLDALARYRRSLDRPAVSIGWGIWQNRGRLQQSEAGQRGVAQLVERGVQAFAPEQGTEALRQLLIDPAGHAVAAAVDWSRMPASQRAGLLEGLGTTEHSAQTDSGMTLAEQLHATPVEQRRTRLEQHVIEVLSRVLRLAPDRIESTSPLGSFGMESLNAVEFRNRLESSLGVTLSATLVWNYPTVADLVDHLADKLGLSLTAMAVDAQPPAGVDEQPNQTPTTQMLAQIVTGVDQMSDEDALQALMKRRGAKKRA